MSRFVRPETVRLPISNGDWILVKARLNAGEHDLLFDRAMLKDAQGAAVMGDDGKPVLDPVKVSRALLLGYLVDWSLTTDDGQLVDIRHQPPEILEAALGDLDFESRQEILLAITAHDTRVRAATAEEKKRRTSGTGSGNTSSSPVDAVGASIG